MSYSFLNVTMDASSIIFIVLLVVMIVALLVVPMFTNKKRAKQAEEQYRSLRPGTRIKTVGGIIGTVLEIRQVSPQDREMVIETGEGDNKTTMTFDIMALYQILSPAAPTDEPENTSGNADANGEVFANDNAKTVTEENAEAVETATEPAATEDPVKAPEEEQAVADNSTVVEEPVAVAEHAAEVVEAPATEEQAATAEQTIVEEQPAEEKKSTSTAKKPAAKKSSSSGSKSTGSTAKKPAAKKPIAKNK